MGVEGDINYSYGGDLFKHPVYSIIDLHRLYVRGLQPPSHRNPQKPLKRLTTGSRMKYLSAPVSFL